MKDFLSNHHIVPALVPVADAFAGGVDTEVVCLRDYRRATLVVMTGAIEDAGISNLVTLNACTDAAKTGATAMAFRYRTQPYSTTVDTWTALALAAATGYNAAAAFPAANVVWFFEVAAEDVQAALAGADFVYATIAETANKTVTAAAFWILSEPRYPQDVPQTAIA